MRSPSRALPRPTPNPTPNPNADTTARPTTRLTALFTALLTVLALTVSAAPGHAANPVTPGNFTGYGFDQCLTPTQTAMDAWLEHSPFLAVGIYISGDSRACRVQPNLTPTWVSTQLSKGWRLLPITLGPQAACLDRFPRYGNDPVIIDDPGTDGRYVDARLQGRAEATKSVAAAKALGIVPGSTLWYDLEGFDASRTKCRESALAFLSGWSYRIKKLGYVSGVYSSAGSGMVMLDQARIAGVPGTVLPTYIWIARWDGIANTSTDYISEEGWQPHRRVKQYRGGHDETWGGVRINIDSNYLDVGRGSVAADETHCGGVRVDFPRYRPLKPGLKRPYLTLALKCLLSERGYFTGAVRFGYGPGVINAAQRWQAARGLPVSSTFSKRHWTALLSGGARPVLKVGSAGVYVRRVQRALNAARRSGDLPMPVTGVYDAATLARMKAWQNRVGLTASGVANSDAWSLLQAGRR